MTQEEITSGLKVGDYGELYYYNKLGYKVRATGKIKLITDDGDIMFYHNDYKGKYLIPPDRIVSFEQKEMLPTPTEVAGRPIQFDNGHWIYTESGKQVNDLKR